MTLRVQIAAFAHELEIFVSDEARKQKSEDKTQSAAESFIPAGLFPPDGQESETIPTAHALITGHVLDIQKRTNQMTGKSFWWLSAEHKSQNGFLRLLRSRRP